MMRSNMRQAGILIGIVLIAALAVRAEDDEDRFASAEGVPPFQPVKQVAEEAKKLGDWDDWYERIGPQLDQFWLNNGWDAEADRFALEMVQDVAEIPPWEFNKRMNTAFGAIRDRYELNDDQYLDMQSRAYGMIGAMAWRHGATMLKHVKEMVETRQRGEPFSAEQVARWAKEGAPIFDDAHRMFERVAREYAESLSPKQRATFERDWESYERRKEAIENLREHWVEGKWRPEEWGLGDDPLYAKSGDERALLRERDKKKREIGAPYAQLTESSWERYVRRFIRRFQLDDAQATAAWSIFHEIDARAVDFREKRRERLALASTQERAQEEIDTRFQKLFEELKSRLHAIPTTMQRRYADVVPPLPREEEPPQVTADGERIPAE